MATVKVLIVGGGGGGGCVIGGGGGGGEVYYNDSTSVTEQAYTVTVGTGGTGSNASSYSALGTKGNDSSCFGVTALGGSAGGSWSASPTGTGASGGGDAGSGTAGGAYTVGKGNDGGAGVGGNQGGGGGGASAAGTTPNGGVGTANSISGTSKVYGSGGGGGGRVGYAAGTGGTNAGNGATAAGYATAGTANYGGGGGGGNHNNDGTNDHPAGAGGSGVVVIAFTTGTINATGGTITTSGGDTIHTFTTSGTFTVLPTSIKKVLGITVLGTRKLMGKSLNKEFFSNPLLSDASLKGYWRYEGNSNDYKATYNGTDSNITYGTSYGKFNQGAHFNGTSSVIRVGNVNIFGGDFTLITWVKRLRTGANDFLFGKYNAMGTDTALHIGFRSTNVMTMAFYSDDADTTATYTDTTNWHHWAFTYTYATKTKTIYYDTTQVKQANGTGNPNFGTATLTFGSSFYGTGSVNYGNIDMDETAAFSRVLTQTEITSVYNTQIKKFMGCGTN